MRARELRMRSEVEGLEELERRSSKFRIEHRPAKTEFMVTLYCPGLVRSSPSGPPSLLDVHCFSMHLEPDFPILPPRLIWRTPVFHPNIAPPFVCLGDHWYPGWSLAELCVAVAEMVRYQKFNIYDPLNKECAAWLDQELALEQLILPLDDSPIFDQDFTILPGRTSPDE